MISLLADRALRAELTAGMKEFLESSPWRREQFQRVIAEKIGELVAARILAL